MPVIDYGLVRLIQERVFQMRMGEMADFYDPRTGAYVGRLRKTFDSYQSWKLDIGQGEER